MLHLGEPTRATKSLGQVASRTRSRNAIVILTLIALLLSGASPISAQGDAMLTGWFSIIWVDGDLSADKAHDQMYFLTDDSRQRHQLDMGHVLAADLLKLQGQRISVSGTLSPSMITSKPIFEVRSVQSVIWGQGTDAALVTNITGNQSYITLLCKFSDVSLDGSVSRSQVEHDVAVATSFWQNSSYDQLTFVNSRVLGWLSLPNPKSYYFRDVNGDGTKEIDFERSIKDCTSIVDPILYFPAFRGINMVFNTNSLSEPPLYVGFGGSYYLTLDGQSRVWYATWNSGPPYGIAGTLIHEMGHSLGLPHSSGPYGFTYSNPWDVMSVTVLGKGTISLHKDMLGWISPGRKLIMQDGVSEITLSRLANPTPSNLLMAQIPIAGSTRRFYTVEYRYRQNDVGNAVVIHEVDLDRIEPAHVIDADNNGNTSDRGTWWAPGEMFVDTANGVRVCVKSVTPDSAQVSIALNVPLSCEPPKPGPFLIAHLRNTRSGCDTDTTLNCIHEIRSLKFRLDYLGGAPSPVSTTLSISLAPELAFKRSIQKPIRIRIDLGNGGYATHRDIDPIVVEDTRLVFDLSAIEPGASIFDKEGEEIEFSVSLTITTTRVLTTQVEISGTNGIVSGTTFFITNPLNVYAPLSSR